MARRTFRIVLIKPSHYDDDGYVIQWWRSTIPSNSLASVSSLMAQAADARVLGPDTDIEIEAYDETNIVIDVKSAIKRIRWTARVSSGSWACSRTSFPARSTWRAASAPRTFRS